MDQSVMIFVGSIDFAIMILQRSHVLGKCMSRIYSLNGIVSSLRHYYIATDAAKVQKSRRIRSDIRDQIFLSQRPLTCSFDNLTAMASNTLLTKDNLREFLDSIDTILTDCDGVLWNGNEDIEGAPETIQRLKAMGKRVFYVTNNSMKTREEYASKCNGLQFPATKDDIIGSSFVAARYIRRTLGYSGRIYMIGGAGLQKELEAEGFTVVGLGPDDLDTTDPNILADFKVDPDIGCVVVGYDPYFNYAKVFKAASHVRNPKCHFIGTNIDSGLPMGDKAVLPGTGSILRCVEVAAERNATVMGKPSKPIFDMAMEMHNLNPAKTIMIGDRLNTDIELGHNCGFRTIHVHTGFNKLEDVKRLQASSDPADKRQIPHYYVPSMLELGRLIQEVYTN